MAFRNLKNNSQVLDLAYSANSEIIPLLSGITGSYVKGYSVMINADVDTPSAVTFDSGVSEVSLGTFPDAGAKAALIQEDLTYTAVSKGIAGNSTTIRYVDPNTPSAALSVGVIGAAITVNLATDAGTAASLIQEDLTYTADATGVAGNSISITYVDPNTPSAALSVGVIGSAITVNLATNAGTAASGNVTITSYADLLVTTPDTVEVAGVVFTAQAGAATPGLAVFQAAVDNTATALSLATQINAHATSGPLVTASPALGVVSIVADATGVAGNALTLAYVDNGAEIGATVSGAGFLAGGVDNVHISTAAQIKAAVDASGPAAALVNTVVSGTGTDIQAAVGVTSLAGGIDNVNISTAAQIRTAVLASGPAAALVAVVISGTGTDIQAAVGATPLAGGDNSGITAGDYIVIYDMAGLAWAVAADMGGSPVPTGAIWASIASGRKAQVDLSANLTAAGVAAAFEVAFDALASVPFTTDDSANDGTMLFSVVIRGNTTNAVTKNANDSTSGSITVAVSVAGVAPEDDIAAETFSIPSHNLPLGLKGQLTTTGTLPAGLSLGVDYFIIPVDANTVKFASSLANALLGTPVDITNQGASGSVNTFTPVAIAGGSYKIQVSLNGYDNTWVDLASAVNITADATALVEKLDPMYDYIRVVYTLTAGSMIVYQNIQVKGE